MKNYKNRIITISGDPASGKGSVARQLEKLYREKGIKTHIISVGDLFRKIAIREYKKKFPNVEVPSIEEINRDPNFAEELKEIDKQIDSEIAKKGEEINSEFRPKEVFIIDARLAWHMIPDSFAIRLTVDKKTAGERVFNDTKRGEEDRYSSLEEATEETASRREKEISRYKEEYGVDLTDPENFDLIIGTTLASVQDIARTIKVCEELDRGGETFCKTWASPELFYPTQSLGMTCFSIPGVKLSIEELAESIKAKGIYPDDPVYSTTITDSPYQFVADGHHRVFASIYAGQTLIPYEAVRNVDANTVHEQRCLTYIYDHENWPMPARADRPDKTRFYYGEYPEVDRESEYHDMCY